MRMTLPWGVSGCLHALLLGGLAMLSASPAPPLLPLHQGRPLQVEWSVSTLAEPETEPSEPRETVTVEFPSITAEPLPDTPSAVLVTTPPQRGRQIRDRPPRELPEERIVRIDERFPIPDTLPGLESPRSEMLETASVPPPPRAARRPASPLPTADMAFEPEELGLDVDELPRPLPSNRPPAYPRDALEARVEGRVTVRVSIQANGDVERVALEISSGTRSLDDSALEAVRDWRFVPARRAGYAVAHEVLLPIRFTLRRD